MRKMTMSFFGQSQYTDWKILLACVCIGLLLVASWGFYLYSKVNRDDFFNSNLPVTQAKKVDRQILTQMISKVEEKQKNFDDLRVLKPNVSDPSL